MTGSTGYVKTIVNAVAKRPDSVACLFEGGGLTWREMLDRASRIAGGLQALGIVPGDRVGVLSPNNDDYCALYLAIPWAGAILVPLNARWSPTENAYAIDDCGLRALFVSDDLVTPNFAMLEERKTALDLIGFQTARSGWQTIETLLAHTPIDDQGRSGDDLFAIFYTGGTTGKPKGVMLSHAGFVANCEAMRDLGICADGCRALVVAPLFHLAAAAVLSMAMLSGTAVLARAFDPGAVLDLIGREQITDALLVPTMIQMLLDSADFDAAKIATLSTILYGASPMPEVTLDRLMAVAPHLEFYQAYGMTEVSCTATVLGPEYHRGAHRAAGRHRGAGKSMSGSEVRIADEAGYVVPQGKVGEILIRGPGLMLGYWNQPEQTAEALRGGWFHTGDGGRLDDHGILYVVDRIKDMIVSGGENVYSAEVEGAISQHPDVAQCAVVGVPDARWGERVHAVVVPRGGRAPTPDTITDHCRTLIAGYKCPRSVEFRDALPLSPAGKVLKNELRAPYWKGMSRNVA